MANHYKVSLKEEKETLLITLQAKAIDSHSKNSILNDKQADEMIHLIDYDFKRLNQFGNEIMVIRAKQIDDWLEDFLKENQRAIVLYLGCGLDTRAFRINPPSEVIWFDVDYPDVIELRKLFFSSRAGYHMLSSDVKDLRWLECIPSDQPVMIIAEGLLEYFSEDEVKMLLHRLTNYFPYGQIAFDVMNSFAVKSGKDRLKESTGAVHKWAVDDIQEVDRLESKLHRIKCLSVFDSTYMEKLPLRVRFPYSILRRIPRFKNMMRILLYKFESGDIRL